MSAKNHCPVNLVQGKTEAKNRDCVHDSGCRVWNKNHFIAMVKAKWMQITASFDVSVSDRCVFTQTKSKSTDTKAQKNSVGHGLNGYGKCGHYECETDKHKYIPPKFKIKTSCSSDHGFADICFDAYILAQQGCGHFFFQTPNQSDLTPRYSLSPNVSLRGGFISPNAQVFLPLPGSMFTACVLMGGFFWGVV